jgi:hypothetical protein
MNTSEYLPSVAAAPVVELQCLANAASTLQRYKQLSYEDLHVRAAASVLDLS